MGPSGFRARARSAGFTLVELMAVVAITGVLAAVGVMLVRNHLLAAKTNDALAVMQSIRAAQESFRAQNGHYIDCSVTDPAVWYPMATPGKVAYEWRQTGHVDWAGRWQQLAVTRTKPTIFGFLVHAGNPGDPYPIFETATDPVLPAPLDPWYVIQVKGDRDADTVAMLGVATSLNAEVYLERESE